MYTTTLRGVFPEPKPVYRRNFIKENVKSIKQMQGILQEVGVIQTRKKSKILDKFKNVPSLAKPKEAHETLSLGNLNRNDVSTTYDMDSKLASKPPVALPIKPQFSKRTKVQPNRKKEIAGSVAEEGSRITHRAMQTEREEDLTQLYDTGVIKYPSPGILKSTRKLDKTAISFQSGQGDQIGSISEELDSLTMEEKDFIKENKNIKTKPSKQSPVKILAQAPPTYQRGVVPKYLRDKKDDAAIEPTNVDCPTGHILLPEEERKETLRVLRQSYADRIQELNMMPVRNDTLKMRKRKMEIEEELKRIDGGIKVFQRPKVFVKINA